MYEGGEVFGVALGGEEGGEGCGGAVIGGFVGDVDCSCLCGHCGESAKS